MDSSSAVPGKVPHALAEFRQPPDVLFIIGDCVSFSAIQPTQRSDGDLHTLPELASEGVSFERAVSPSYWSLPAHASLLTGTYPWEHGVISDGLRISEDQVTLARLASGLGYRAGAFSSNPYISDETGLSSGFEVCSHGSFAEMYAKGLSLRSLGSFEPGRPKEGQGTPSATQRLMGSFLKRNPWAVDIGVGVVERFLARDSDSVALVSPWIESEMYAWLRKVDLSSPAFCLVNLMDAHEPYVGLRAQLSRRRSRAEVWDALRLPWIVESGGGSKGHNGRLAILRELYNASVGVVDRRVGRIVDGFTRARSGRDPLIVFVGDHGQAFGGGADLYHAYGLSDEVFRVPLIIRPPGGLESRRVVKEWTSTKDVFHFLRRIFSNGAGHGGPFDWLGGHSPSVDPVWAFAEVPTTETGTEMQSDRHHGQGIRVVCYLDSVKAVYDPEGGQSCSLSSYREGGIAGETFPPQGMANPIVDREAERISRAIVSMRVTSPDTSVGRRLSAWGYS